MHMCAHEARARARLVCSRPYDVTSMMTSVVRVVQATLKAEIGGVEVSTTVFTSELRITTGKVSKDTVNNANWKEDH